MNNNSIKNFQKGLYEYYLQTNKDGDSLSFESFVDAIKEYKNRDDKFIVYVGYGINDTNKDKILYVGTTIQYPISRWYYHIIHGNNLIFKEVFRFNNKDQMLEKEFELINKYHPKKNKITDRPQNYNVKLTDEELERRIGNPEWCQSCFKRRVSKGYTICWACSRF